MFGYNDKACHRRLFHASGYKQLSNEDASIL
jgi:hypothetical protein